MTKKNHMKETKSENSRNRELRYTTDSSLSKNGKKFPSSEFNLSKKIGYYIGKKERIKVEDVKEFIKNVRKDICCCEFVKPKLCSNCYALNYYAGDKLK